MHVKVLEREGTDHLPAILAELNVRHAETKRRNPRGFLDQFESQLETHCLEVAQQLGGTYEPQGDDHVFRFLR